MSEWHIYNPRGGHIGIVQAENMAEARRLAEERWPGEMGACVGRINTKGKRKLSQPTPEPENADQEMT